MNSRYQIPFVLIGWVAVTCIADFDAVNGASPAFVAPVYQEAADENEDEMKLIERLDQLQLQLDSPELDQRDAAEKEILKLGLKVLDYLETPQDASSDVLLRIGRVRSELEKIAIVKFTEATTVKLSGSFSLDDALKSISQQTGNRISVERVPEPILEQQLELDFENVEFWAALNDLLNRSSLAIDPYAGEVGELRLTVDRTRVDNPALRAEVEAVRVPRSGAGVFDCSVPRVISTRDFAKPGANATQVTMLVRWEPRLQPISIDMPFESVTIADENENILPLARTEGVFHGSASGETKELEIYIPLQLVDRKVKKIKSLEAELIAVMPGRQETFRFRKIGHLDSGAEQKKGGATVTFEGVIKNEDLFGVTLTLSFDESFNALESYRAWAYDNPMYLENEEGKKLQPVTIEGLRQSNDRVTIRYYFLEDPKEMNIVYKSVGAIIKHSIVVKIKNIDLP
jgi:hypothetical protein